MEHTSLAFQYVEHLSYIGFFLAVAFSGYAIPVPEEIVLLLAGYLAAEGIIHLPIVIIVCVLGAVFGDFVIYYLSGHGSRFTQKYHARVEQTHLGWYMRHMKENTAKTVFFSRFIVGMRFFNPLISGLMRVPADIFVLSTALSATIYIPIIIFLGYYFSSSINTVIHLAELFRETILLLLVAGSTFLILVLFKNLWERARGPQ